MASIGDSLRQARMRQGLDIIDVERSTKIRAKYLRALENEEFDLLPGPTFVKTFLRTYSEVLGLDPHVLVEAYRTGYEPRADEGELQPLASPPPEPRGWRPGPPGRGVAVGLAVLAVLAFLLVLGLTGEEEGGDQGQSASETTTERAKPRPRKPKPKPRPSGVTLEVTPQGPVYVCLDEGPGTDVVFEGTLTEARSFKAKKLRINLGRTAVEMEVNGKPFPVEPVGNPVGYEFSTSGSKELPSGQRPCASA